MAKPSGGLPYWLAPTACVIAVPIVVLLALAAGHDPVRAEDTKPLHARDKDYVGASACKSCHEDHWSSWRRTFHSTMTQLPTEQSVLGRFNGEAVTLFGSTAIPFQHDERYFFRLPAIGTQAAREAEVAFTVGSRRYQQYIARRGRELVRLPVAYHIEEQRWFHMNGAFLTPDPQLTPEGTLARADYERHVTRWNDNCVFCHNVAPNPGKRPGPYLHCPSLRRWNQGSQVFAWHLEGAERETPC
jgi:hypothetical protein